MAKYGRGLDTELDAVPSWDDEGEALVFKTCEECEAQYVWVMSDVMELHEQGRMPCLSCGVLLDVSGNLDYAWEV